MRKKIGIITGSGPEAGVDLWQKVLKANKDMFKDSFRGDLDAPNVTILSIPELGYSMELEKNYDMVWDILEKAVKQICLRVDYFVIACNTLNLYAKKIEEIGYKNKFISTLDVVREYIYKYKLDKICIIGALPILEMKEYSVFQSLNEIIDIEVPKNKQKVHKIIYGVKKYGGENKNIIDDFNEVLETLHSKDVFLACTELPLIKTLYKNKNLIDVTNLLAKTLVKKTF